MNERILLAPAGWEVRYEEGVYVDLVEFKPSKILVPFSRGYSSRTLPLRTRIQAKAKSLNIQYVEIEQDYCDAVTLYKTLSKVFDDHLVTATHVRFNATTTPRDLIWYALHLLSVRKIHTEFSYFKPLKYSDDYLSRDAKAPRLVLKRSGIAYPDQPTCVLALSGFDDERLSQLKQRYEPKTMLIGYQSGNQLDNAKRNSSVRLEPSEGEKCFEFNCYDVTDKSLDILCTELSKLNEPHNVIAASLGPKPSALTLFKLTQVMPEVGLVYIPAGDYSEDYSIGIDLVNRTLDEIKW